MKKITSFLFIATLFSCGLTFAVQKTKKVEVAEAATVSPNYPSGGAPGSVVFIEAGSYFNDYDAVLYCWNTTTNAFSAKSNYKVPGTNRIAVFLPSGGTWNKFIVCRYYKDKDPLFDGWSGVEKQSPDYGFSETFIYGKNTISLNSNFEIASAVYNGYTHYGAGSNERMYLDLSSFTDWENENAKFALYFANPMLSSGDAWSSMMTKVEGSENDHLYECTVPGVNAVWNLVIPVRFDPQVQVPGWWNSGVWTQTNDIYFNDTNHNNNVLTISDWESGSVKSETITRNQRVEMYGQHFLDTVACSGNGDSDVTTSEQWESVKTQYQNMHTDYQGDVWTTIANKDNEASKVAQAMARYDYILFYKKYNHEDFINRGGSAYQTQYAASPISVLNNAENNSTSLMIAIIASVSLISVSTLIVVKKSRTKEKSL